MVSPWRCPVWLAEVASSAFSSLRCRPRSERSSSAAPSGCRPWDTGCGLRPRVRDALLLTLTAAAGSVDAVSYLGLGRVLTANMTGNLVLLGIAIGQGQLAGSLRSIVAFAGFVIGFSLGVRLTQGFPSPSGGGQGGGGALWPRSVSPALLAELALLLGLFAGWELTGDRPAPVALDILTVVSAGAMGMQTAAARRIGVAGVTTTFVTGMLTGLIAALVTAGGSGRSEWTLWAATLACLVIGAAAGAAVFTAWRPGAPLVAVLLVGTVLVAATWSTRRRD
jgi:uncharacterized membrane protein YoaK (UPF0700 family)